MQLDKVQLAKNFSYLFNFFNYKLEKQPFSGSQLISINLNIPSNIDTFISCPCIKLLPDKEICLKIKNRDDWDLGTALHFLRVSN